MKNVNFSKSKNSYILYILILWYPHSFYLFYIIFFFFLDKIVKNFNESESEVTYSQVWWPILGIRALHLTHPKCTHTAVNTHTVNTHPEQWPAIYAAAPGSSWGFRWLAQGHLSRGIEGEESAGHSLPPPTIPAGPRLELAIFLLRVRLSNH